MEVSFKSILDRYEDSKVWGYLILVPLDIALEFKKANIKRLICTIPAHAHSMPCAIMPRGGDRYFILFNKDHVKKLNIDVGTTLEIHLSEDKSEFGMPLCEELSILLQEDEEFNLHFRKLTPGKQRNVIYYIGKPKSSDLRIRTAVIFSEHLKKYNGQLDFKILAQEMKEK